MEIVSGQRENSINHTNPLSDNQGSNGRLFLYNGSYHFVMKDENNKEFIFDKSGKKLYLHDIAILSMKNEVESQKERYFSSLETQKSHFQKWKNYWASKLQIANETYDIMSQAKKTASSNFNGVLTKTGCSTLDEVKQYDKANGGGYYNMACEYDSERTAARMGQIRAESDSIFYGRMYVDESNNLGRIKSQEIMSRSLFS